MKKILFSAFALSSIMFSSCEPEEPKIDISYEKALMDRTWKVVEMVQNPNVNDPENTWYSIYNSQDPCILDNILIFTSKNTAILDEHFRKCNISDPQEIRLNYMLENENHIKLYAEGGNAGGPYWRSGDFKWLNEGIKRFSIDERIADPTTPDILVSTIYTYEKIED